MLENIVIRDPRTGNTAYHKEIEKRIEQFHLEINALRSKGEAFLDKVVSYYQQKREGGRCKCYSSFADGNGRVCRIVMGTIIFGKSIAYVVTINVR
jgi:hypothetical protein